MRAAVGEEAVSQAEGLARVLCRLVGVVDCIAITFVLVLVVEGFGVGEDDARAFTAGDDEFGVGGGEGFAVEQQVSMTSWPEESMAAQEVGIRKRI